MKKVLVFLLVPLMLLAFSGSEVSAKRSKKGDRSGRRGFIGNPVVMKERLGLSDGQVNQISAINLEYKKKHLEYEEKIAPKRIALKRMLLEASVNLEEVRSLLKQISDLRVEVRMLRIKQKLDIEEIFTPSQRATAKTFKRKKGKR